MDHEHLTVKWRAPVRLAQIFTVPVDTTDWNGQYKDDQPVRASAPFNQRSSLTPVVRYSFPDTPMLYLWHFEIPQPAMYLGKTAGDALARFLTHRCKATGSQVGDGVSHTGNSNAGWKSFVAGRQLLVNNSAIRAQEKLDLQGLSDVWFSIGTVHDRDEAICDINTVEWVEGTIHRREACFEKIAGFVFGPRSSNRWVLTTNTNDVLNERRWPPLAKKLSVQRDLDLNIWSAQ